LTAPPPAKVIIDTDPGVDDAVAILMALASDSLEVIGLTTVGGNVPLARTTRNALALLEYAGRADIPVARGNSRPVSGRYGYAQAVHGVSGLTRRLPNPTSRPIEETAVEFLASQLQEFPQRITLIALGPLTNLARLLLRHPPALHRVDKLVIMGGAVNAAGNVTQHAEFNFYSDPHAADLVLSSGVPMTLVDLAACQKVAINREDAANLKSHSSLGTLAVQLLNNWFRRDSARQRFVFYDPLALAVALDPEVVTTRNMGLSAETADPDRLGKSSVTGAPGPVALAQQVDVSRFFTLFQGLLGLEEAVGG